MRMNDLLKSLLLFIFLIGFLGLASFQKVLAQCSVEAFASMESITCGDSIRLSAVGNSGNLALDNDFNSGTPGTGWSATSAATYTNPCVPPVDGTTYLWMGDATPHPRVLTTLPLDLSLGGIICFDLVYATQGNAAPCEGPDLPDEGVHLEFSTNNGATWTPIYYFDPAGGYDQILTNWNNYCFPIPAAATTPNTIINWRQGGSSGAGYDHWGIDNIQIILNDPSYYYVWTHNGFVGPSPPVVHPRGDTSFTVLYTNGTTDSCFSTVDIDVLLPVLQIDAGTDTTLCLGDCTDINATAEVLVRPGGVVTFENIESVDLITDPFGASPPAVIEMNIAGLNMQTIQPNSIASVCFNIYDIFGGAGLLDLSTLTVSLECPDGTQLLLTNSGTGASFGGGNIILGPGSSTCFTLNAATTISGGIPPYVGNYLPDAGGSLNNLAGCTANGIWQLKVTNTAIIAFGQLASWSITFDDPDWVTPAQFSWNPTTNMTASNSLTPNVCPTETGIYNLVVWDQNNCAIDSDQVAITVDSVCCFLEIDSIAITDPNCGNSDGGILIFTNLTPGSIVYSIDNGVTVQPGPSFTGLASGSYTVIVRDGSGCADTTSISLNDQGGPTIDTIITSPPSCGVNDGSISILATGGNPPLEYSIDNGLTFVSNPVFSSLGAGQYNIIVMDDANCQASQQIIFIPADAPVITLNTTPPTCGENNGIIIINISTGGTAPFQYSIDNGVTYSATNSFNNLAPGSYDVVVLDDAGCQAIDQVVFNPSSGVVLSLDTFINASCGQADGSATVVASGGSLPYTYSWSNGQASATAINLPAGTITAYVIDAMLCADTLDVIVSNLNGPTASVTKLNDAACGQPNGSAEVIATGGRPPYTYLWSNGQPDSVATGLAPGSHTATVVDMDSCLAVAQVIIHSIDLATVVSFSGETCNAANGMAVVTPTGTPGYSFIWSTGEIDSMITGLSAGDYFVTVTDAVNCDKVDTVTIDNIAGPSLSYIAKADTCGLGVGVITLTVSGGTAPYLYSWSHDLSLADPVADRLTEGDYQVTVTDDNLCEADTPIVLNCIEQVIYGVHIPTAFTPNNDGVNDFITVFGKGVTSYTLKIYNRWGELVWSISDMNALNVSSRGWNGTYKGEPLNMAVFTYFLDVEYFNKETELIKGNITLIR